MATTPPQPLFLLTEYDTAFRQALFDAVQEMARSRDPILSQIRVEKREQVGTSVVTADEESVVELPPMSASLEVTFERKDVIAGDLDGLLAVIDDAAEQHLRIIMPQFFESISRITDATGNTVDAGGRPFSPELLLEALEKIEWSFDENDEPILPTLVMSPEMAEKVAKLPPMTPEQEKAFADLKERKRAEYRASKRHRKLS